MIKTRCRPTQSPHLPKIDVPGEIFQSPAPNDDDDDDGGVKNGHRGLIDTCIYVEICATRPMFAKKKPFEVEARQPAPKMTLLLIEITPLTASQPLLLLQINHWSLPSWIKTEQSIKWIIHVIIICVHDVFPATCTYMYASLQARVYLGIFSNY